MAKYVNIDALGIGPCNAAFFADVSYAKGWNAVLKILDDMPTADVRPVVRGEWVKADVTNQIRKKFQPECCSVCRREKRGNWNFCPNCGADNRKYSGHQGVQGTSNAGQHKTDSPLRRQR